MAEARENGITIAKATVVPRHIDGTRFVRSSWFTDFWRAQDPKSSSTDVVNRMLRVGWQRRGKEG